MAPGLGQSCVAQVSVFNMKRKAIVKKELIYPWSCSAPLIATCTEMYIANTGDPRLGPSGFLLHLETDVVATPRAFGKSIYHSVIVAVPSGRHVFKIQRKHNLDIARFPTMWPLLNILWNVAV